MYHVCVAAREAEEEESGLAECGGATRIREHITGGGNITACTCDTDAFLDLKQTMIEESSGKQDAKK